MEKLIKCRNCKKKNLKKSFSLGNLSYSGKFAKNKQINIPKNYLSLLLCQSCGLVQLDRNFDPKYMYSDDYGYRSGINKTMRDHLISVTKDLAKRSNLKSLDMVMDIASNDATLLNSYKIKKLIKVGVDPILSKFSKESWGRHPVNVAGGLVV